MARRGRTTPSDDDQMSLDFLWGADDSQTLDQHQVEESDSAEGDDGTQDHEQQAVGTPVAGTQTGETDERDLHRDGAPLLHRAPAADRGAIRHACSDHLTLVSRLLV